VENKTAIKINNLIVACWLNILSASMVVSHSIIVASTPLTSHSCLLAFSRTGVYRPGKLAIE